MQTREVMNNPSAKLPAKQRRNDQDDSKPPAKRSRHDSGGDDSDSNGDNSHHATLSSDALFVVMSFLHPRDLFKTAFTCKTLRDTVTTKIVVQSALIHGGHAKKTMEELHALTSTHSIHVPSALRLLRLTCGKVCEFCAVDRVNHVRPHLGVFACWDCVTGRSTSGGRSRGGLTRPWKKGWVRYSKDERNRAKYDAVFEHPRIAATAGEYGTNYFVWSDLRSDRGGEPVGPIVSWGDVDEMANRFPSATDMVNGGIDEYLANDLNAPSVESYGEFNDTFRDMERRAEAAAREREDEKRAKNQKTKQNKIAKVEKMMIDLEALIDEPFQELAMKRTENKHFRDRGAKMSATPCVCMETRFVDHLLEPYVITPSKMKKKILKELAENINGKLRIINDKRLLALDFLSEGHPFEAALKLNLRERLPDLDALFEEGKYINSHHSSPGNIIPSNKICVEFLSRLESDDLMGAIGHLMNEDFSPMLLAVNPSARVARSAVNKNYRVETIRKLAKHFWSHCLTRERADSDSRYREAFAASQTMFVEAMEALDEYSAWLLKEDEPEARRTFQLNYAARFSQYVWDLVLKREFARVNELMGYEWEWHNLSLNG